MDWEISKNKHKEVKNIISIVECWIVKGISTNKGFWFCSYSKWKIQLEVDMLKKEIREPKKVLTKWQISRRDKKWQAAWGKDYIS